MPRAYENDLNYIFNRLKDAKEVEMNGKGGKKRAAMKGTCPVCGTGMFKILGMKK